MIRACDRNTAILTAATPRDFKTRRPQPPATTMKYHCVFPRCRGAAAFVDCFFIPPRSQYERLMSPVRQRPARR